MSDEAWVTLATNDTYALGVLVLAQSLRRTGTTRQLHCLITPGVSQGMREHLWSVFNAVSIVDVLDSSDEENLLLIQRPELGVTFTKLHCWRLTQYKKCVFLDADTLVLRNADALFDHEELSAAPDIGWPDIFNSGVFVFQPSLDTYRALLMHARNVGSFDGGDQGLLNTFFDDWRTKDAKFRLSFIYNMSSNVVYTYAAAYKKYGKDVKIVHFLGTEKPWNHPHTGVTLHYRSECQHLQSHVQYWWTVFTEDVQALLSPEYLPESSKQQALMTSDQGMPSGASTGLSGYGGMVGGEYPKGSLEDDLAHQRAWEAGHVDYLGRDSWNNIQKRLDKALGSGVRSTLFEKLTHNPAQHATFMLTLDDERTSDSG